MVCYGILGTSGSHRLGARATLTSGVVRRRRVKEASAGVVSKCDAWPASGLATRVPLTPNCAVPSRSSLLFNSEFFFFLYFCSFFFLVQLPFFIFKFYYHSVIIELVNGNHPTSNAMVSFNSRLILPSIYKYIYLYEVKQLGLLLLVAESNRIPQS